MTSTLPEPEELKPGETIPRKFHGNVRSCKTTHRSGGPFGCGFDQQYGFVGGMSDYWEHHSSWSRDGALAWCTSAYAQHIHMQSCTAHARCA